MPLPTTASSMNKIKRAFDSILPILFWLGVWELSALLFSNKFLLPNIRDTISALFEIMKSADFYVSVFLTLLRVALGLILGILAGVILAILSNFIKPVRAVIAPIISVIKSTPVASFIIILWIIMSGDVLSVFIAFLMVMPIVWQNMMDGFDAIDKELLEVCDIFEVSFIQKLRILILPTLFKYFIPAVITSVGLGWKSEIAAEIIAYTENSIGHAINDSKMNFDTASVFAWTLVVIILSIIFEKIAKMLLKRCTYSMTAEKG